MDWIKRNLYFVIGSLVALALLGGAGWYFYSAWKANTEIVDKLNEQYTKLDTLNKQNPHPGRPPHSDNIALAKQQQGQLKEIIARARKGFQPIPSLPEGPKVAGEDFISSLRQTIDQLQKTATNTSINLPNDYGFSFAAQRQQMKFSPGSLEPLAAQLGEVKALCDALFQARINALDFVRRERCESARACSQRSSNASSADCASRAPPSARARSRAAVRSRAPSSPRNGSSSRSSARQRFISRRKSCTASASDRPGSSIAVRASPRIARPTLRSASPTATSGRKAGLSFMEPING